MFFVFVEILNHVKKLNPNVKFLQENVGSAPKLDIGIMSRLLGIYPVRINSKLVTAQNRDRYYWTNIKTKETMFDVVSDIPQPKDRMIFLKDIIESVQDEEEFKKQKAISKSNRKYEDLAEPQIIKEIGKLEKVMQSAARNLEFEKAANARDQIKFLKEKIYGANIQDKIK